MDDVGLLGRHPREHLLPPSADGQHRVSSSFKTQHQQYSAVCKCDPVHLSGAWGPQERRELRRKHDAWSVSERTGTVGLCYLENWWRRGGRQPFQHLQLLLKVGISGALTVAWRCTLRNPPTGHKRVCDGVKEPRGVEHGDMVVSSGVKEHVPCQRTKQAVWSGEEAVAFEGRRQSQGAKRGLPGGRAATTSLVAAAAFATREGESSSGMTSSLTVGNSSGPAGRWSWAYFAGQGDPHEQFASTAPRPVKNCLQHMRTEAAINGCVR